MEDDQTFHCHSAVSEEHVNLAARKKLVVVIFLCLTFMVVETVGGVLSNSLALFTDVLHLGSDLISFLISLLAIYLSRKPPTRTMSFGYHRAEILGALLSVLLIWLITGVLCYMAVERIIYQTYRLVQPDEMLVTAVLGVVFNLIMASVLHGEVFTCCSTMPLPHFGHQHSHQAPTNQSKDHTHSQLNSANQSKDHTHSQLNSANQSKDHAHHHTIYGTTGRREEMIDMGGYEELNQPGGEAVNINVRAAMIHVVGDVVQSFGVLLAALIIKLETNGEWRLADPVCTFVFSLIVLVTTLTISRDVLRVLLGGVPDDVSYEQVKTLLEEIDGVRMVHSLHIWPLTMGRNAMTVHVAKDDDYDYERIMVSAISRLKSKFKFSYLTVQVENYNFEIMSTCKTCQDPA